MFGCLCDYLNGPLKLLDLRIVPKLLDLRIVPKYNSMAVAIDVCLAQNGFLTRASLHVSFVE